MRPEQILKTEKRKSTAAPAVRPERRTAQGAAAGLPVFLKEARGNGSAGSGVLERHADAVAQEASAGKHAASAGERAASAGEMESGERNGAVASPTAAAAIPSADAGSPLQESIRARVEPVLGVDLSRVRVHEAGADRDMADRLNARAFTHGQQIWMGPRESSSDLGLMAHEAAHVAQQGAAPQTPSIQKQQKTAAPTTGTTTQMVTFVNSPQLEAEPSLRTVLTMLNRYLPTVDVGAVDFRVMQVTQSYVSTGLTEDGRSHWEGNKPVIELTQEKYDTIAQHLAGTAAVSDVHDVVRTVGHELYHLYREKTGNQANPIQPLFAAEAGRRMEEIRQNWVEWAKDPGSHKNLGIPAGVTVTRWEDIPEAERKKIEADASQTSRIQGFYEQTAYLVEETYVRIEEISYLRVQQQAETGPKKPSQAAVSQIANLIWRFNTALDQTVGNVDFMTAELLARTKAAMLDFLRRRYPHKADPSVDSFEVIFYLNARDNGMAPLYDDTGALVSVVPPEARVK